MADRAQRLLSLLGAEADALRDTYHGLDGMLAGGRTTAAEWPVQPALALMVGAVRIARELDQLENQLRRDAARLLTGTALDGLAALVADDARRRPLDRRDVAVDTLDQAVTWLRARLGER